MQKENFKIRSDLEKEMSMRQTYQLQAEAKDQLIDSLRAQVDGGTKQTLTSTDPIQVIHTLQTVLTHMY